MAGSGVRTMLCIMEKAVDLNVAVFDQRMIACAMRVRISITVC